ncbi:putative L-gulonolactone oxidase [Trichinella spiralis]|uniref:L-gulonolactone oxidase n=1 Tax=Trichinella spiralis TaxID=6334 RepID=A0ABR3K736_TRISP
MAHLRPAPSIYISRRSRLCSLLSTECVSVALVTKEDHSTISNLVMAKSRDEPLTSSIAEDWMEETDSIELHVYGDTTKWTYGAVAYLKVISKDKTTSIWQL